MNIFSKKEIFQKISDFLDQNPNGVLEIFGPTASGKTDLSVEIAKTFGPAEVISVDSRQVFRGFDVSSAKITEEEMQGVPHWGLDLITPEEEYSVADFQWYAFQKIQEIQVRGPVPILCGGTMLWLDAISENYIFAENKKEKSTQKGSPRWPFLKIGIHWNRDVLYNRCNRRAVGMFEHGLIEEVQTMRKHYPAMTRSASTNLGYQEIQAYLDGLYSFQEALEHYQKRTRNYAKRQLTWWRGRDDIQWIEGANL